MNAYTRRRLLASTILGVCTIPFVSLLRLVQGAGSWQSGVALGFCLGFAVGLAEFFLFRGQWIRLPFLLHLALKSVILMLVMYGAFAALNVLDVLLEGLSWPGYWGVLVAPSTLIGLVQGLAVVAVLLFFVQLDRLLGPGVLLGLFMGRYHRPRTEERIFMFLDLRGSTAIAERLEPGRYFEFLRRCFGAMSEPILASKAEIYQYVGDEVVLTWRMRTGLEEASCVRVFFAIEAQLERRGAEFLTEFNAAPEFKAGVHAGEVIAAQIGDLKREVAYSGDVLSTAARIQSLCNELGHRLLVSRTVFSRMHLGSDFEIESLGPIPLRGRVEEVELFGVAPKASARDT